MSVTFDRRLRAIPKRDPMMHEQAPTDTAAL